MATSQINRSLQEKSGTMKLELNSRQIQILKSVCDTLIPSIKQKDKYETFWELKASDLEIHEKLREVLALQSQQDQEEFKILLKTFELPLIGFLLSGKWNQFDKLDFEIREKWLKNLSSSSIPAFRKGFQALKKLTCFLFYTDTSVKDPNPTWEHIAYPGPLTSPPDKPKSFYPLFFNDEAKLSCDVVIVGSGAGGGVVAKELAEAGKDVIVIDKGGYFNEADFTQKETEMISQLYEKSGALTNKQGSMSIFAGSCLGGGTVVNWAGTIRTPDYILDEWAKEHQAPCFLSSEFKKSLDQAEKNIFTNTDQVDVNPQNSKLKNGSEKLGHLYKPIPQNVVIDKEEDQRLVGYSCFGDQSGFKQSTLNTHLEDANKNGCRFLVNTEIENVIIKNGKATGVYGWQTHSDGHKTHVSVFAKKVVIAAGAIHTPAILMRSGLQHKHIGRNLHLHPVMGVCGIYEEEINGWWGGMMTITNDQFTNLDGNYGFKIETPPAHTGLIGSSLPWLSAKQHKEMVLQSKHMANFIILARDKYAGKITLDKEHKPVIDYKLSQYDLNHLLIGIKEGIKIHLAAGAQKAHFLHNQLPAIETSDLNKLDQIVDSLSWKENQYNLFSAHQMGSCRIGGDKKLHPVSPEGETYEVKDLFVMDASAFPKCSGVNPMLTIEALAHYLSQGLK